VILSDLAKYSTTQCRVVSLRQLSFLLLMAGITARNLKVHCKCTLQ